MFDFFCCGYLGATPIPYVRHAILNLPNPYLRSTTVLLDNSWGDPTESTYQVTHQSEVGM